MQIEVPSGPFDGSPCMDVTHGKPAPDLFLLAARLLGVEPARCLVFEDADFGIQAAEAAGMKWVKVPSRKP